ncbi:MAG TPA: DUF2975 domain-containing protein [Rhizomicrobium sp.]|nr:DUF2975 domain-containing protein [Rhizomicrobium sp.]
MTNTAWLPKVLRWMFAILSVLSAIAAVALVAFLIIDPNIPFGTHFGPVDVKMGDQTGVLWLKGSTFTLSGFRGAVVLTVDNARGLIDVLKHKGVPVAILSVAFYAVLFDLLRRLFRNVSRGQSFTQKNLRLVQSIGLSLLVFSIVSALAESWFHYAVLSYLSEHAWLTISGTTIHFPTQNTFVISGHNGIVGDGDFSGGANYSSGGGFPFGTPVFFSGLLVLALSEVFRQGLALKNESDLTV